MRRSSPTSGAPADDYDGRPRTTEDGNIDIGAYEYAGGIRVISWGEVVR